MLRFFMLLAVCLAWCAPAAAQDAAEAPLFMDDVHLAWERPPSLSRMARLYPRNALRDGVGRGTAHLSCTARVNGRVSCHVLEEDPGGYGFGRAGVQVMDRAIVRTLDGGSPEGRTFLFTLRFGNWPASTLPDRFHPAEAGLRWVRRPSLAEWDGVGQARRETYSALYQCAARADGFLDCNLVESSPDDIERFLQTAAEALETARVRTIDGSSPEGRRFRWEFSLTRQSN